MTCGPGVKDFFVLVEHRNAIGTMMKPNVTSSYEKYPNEGQNLSVYVLSTKNSAYLDTSSMYALEFERNIMKVDASKTTFRHCLCAYSTESVIVKSEPDKFGNYAKTTFKVYIIDRFEPVFHECPHDRVIQSSDLFEWTAPTVTDNVGVQDIDGPVLPQKNKTNVVPGTYTVIYKAIDWSNNTTTCQFTIIVKDPSETAAALTAAASSSSQTHKPVDQYNPKKEACQTDQWLKGIKWSNIKIQFWEFQSLKSSKSLNILQE
ncbi:Hypothetical predicted protein [Mytilus galloprovincialis]|uniref:HYR domain-containing protein n=1 Tax=Mytilus galloprovincialis TaxID=29158 RepID=A0A8B6CHB2_MYTGA|nr:Hypothetical predicted protein [Mytilus galloprovincialis]